MAFDLQIRGWDQVERRIRALAAQYPIHAQQALRIEAEIEMGEAKERTPVRTGALRASGRVESLLGQIGIRWAFGGAAIDYAIPVHENLEAFHRVGQAKYLESVLVEATPYLADRVATRMRALLGGGL
jgi:hypothetical protein